MKKCFICGHKALLNENLNIVECNCSQCGLYAYEKNFLTSYEYYLSVNNKEKKEKIQKFLKKYIKNHKVCFVDDFETSTILGYELKELRDILNMVGLEITHNNTIDSNWTD